MKGGWIRKGLVAVGVLCILVAVVWFVVVDRVIEMVIESEGSKAVGAKVDVAQVDLSLIPAGIEVLGVEVTDPDSPMTNAVAVNRIYSDIELLPLVRRNVIVNNLRMEGIRLGTARKTSGAMPQYARSRSEQQKSLPPWLAQMCQGESAVQFKIPDVEDILAAEQLQTPLLAKQLRDRIDSAKTQWEQKLNELPNQKDLEAYKERFNKLKSSGGGLAALMGSATELQSLHADLKSDMDKIKQAQKGFNVELETLKEQSAQLTKAPIEELQRLKTKYALSPEGVANLSRTLFGPKICEYWKKGYHWYARLKPYLDREATGQDQPDTPEPKNGGGDNPPFFLIRKAHIDALLDIGNFTGQANDITSDPKTLGKPMTFKFLGRQLKEVQSINMNGTVDFIQPKNPKHNVKLFVQAFNLENLNLSDSDSLALSIAKALADIKMDLNLAGPKLDALVDAQLANVQMAISKTDTSDLNTALADALESVTRFGLKAIVEGNDPDYSTKIESDLDRVLKTAVGAMVQKAGAKLESKLSTAISEKTKGAIDDAQKQLVGMDALNQELIQRLNLGNDFLKNIKLPF